MKIFFNSLEIVFLRSIAQKIKKTFFIKYVSLRTFIIKYLFVSGREDGSDSTQPEQTSKLRIQESGHLNITTKTQDQDPELGNNLLEAQHWISNLLTVSMPGRPLH